MRADHVNIIYVRQGKPLTTSKTIENGGFKMYTARLPYSTTILTFANKEAFSAWQQRELEKSYIDGLKCRIYDAKKMMRNSYYAKYAESIQADIAEYEAQLQERQNKYNETHEAMMQAGGILF